VRKSGFLLILSLVVVGTLGSMVLRGADDRVATLPDPVLETSQVSLERAEELFAEGSYALAHDLYAELDALNLPAEDERWVDFRLADTLWRSQAATRTADTTQLDEARLALERLVRDVRREEDRDRVWVEVQESLGDFWWVREGHTNWGQAWPYYEKALDWWAGSPEIELARERYLAIVWRGARPPRVPPYYYYGYFGNQLSLAVLENALEIAVEPGDRAHAQYLIAMNLRQQGGDEGLHRRTDEAFREALEAGRATEWHDDALYHYAEWLSRAGKIVRLDGAGFRQEPDYVRAVEIFRRLISDYAKGETRYYDDAKRQIESITGPTVGVAVSNIFLPGSEIQYYLNWRNVEKVQLTLLEVQLTQDLELVGQESSSEWLNRLAESTTNVVRRWTHDTNDTGEHRPGQQAIVFDETLPAGAYVLEARASGKTARDLLLVTRSALVMKTAGRQALVYVCDAIDGSPMSDADVVVWFKSYANNRSWSRLEGRTDDDGLLQLELPDRNHGAELFAVSAAGENQAFSPANVYRYQTASQQWRVYVFTDRPAYRPNEQVQWKVIARRNDRGDYSTPAGETLRYRITDPRGTELEKGEFELNDFGSAWATLELGEELPLGEYRIEFREARDDDHIGVASLFRMEEYKLPEFKVTVATPEEDDRPKSYRIGEEVEAEVVAEYYFGGPVAGATVEAVVYQRPLYIWWHPPRKFPWFYEDMTPGHQYWWGGQGQIVERKTLTTDATGRARVRFKTPSGTSQDFQYTIEARVTDASRREVVGTGTVRVSRQRYFAFARAQHNLHRPGDQVRVEIKTIDANEQPVPAEGRLRVTRDRWVEIWVDPAGREVTGADLEKTKRRESTFPPLPGRPGGPTWRLKFEGYEHDEVLSRLIRTDEEGTAEIEFTPDETGYYRVAWSGDEQERWPVRAEATVWVADRDTRDLGYRHGGIQILVDRDTLRAGRTTPVMLSAPVQGAWVLFSVEGEDLYDYRVVHMDGTVKLIELEVSERYIPNIFLDAVMIHDGELSVDSRQVVVPPVENFLEVEVASDRERYQPGEEGVLSVTTRDHDGRPVSAEVALALVDDSIFYIQQDYAGDPRQFFYGTKRVQWVQTQSTFHQKRYVRLVEGPEGSVVDYRVTEGRYDRKEEDRDGYRERKKMASGAFNMGEVAFAEGAADSMAPRSSVSRLVAQKGVVAEAEMAEGRVAGLEAAPGTPAVQVRSDFRATAIWQPDLVTDANGKAQIEVKFPDSLTTWRATARVAGRGNTFGTAGSTTKTRKPLIVRLQAPRFFVAGDEVTLSAVLNNNTDEPFEVSAALDAEGLDLLGRIDGDGRITVPANGEARVDWRAAAREAGEATLTVEARGGEFADAMLKSYAVYEHGIDKLLYRSGKVRGDDVRVTLDLPRERRPGSTELTVQITPSMAVTMLDALPYLIDYPYGCTEQTMSRFLPSVIVSRTLESLGLDRESVATRIFGGVEQEYAAKTHPDGKKELAELDRMVRKGLERLYDFQHADGGWGWWKKGDSDHFMTAYVVWGLGLARDAGVKVRDDAIRRGRDFLDKELVEQEDHPDLQAWMLHALTATAKSGSPTRFQRKAFDNLWQQRDRLNAYTRALLALSAHHIGDNERARTLVRNLENGVKRDRSPDTSVIVEGLPPGSDAVIGTAHWGEDGIYWRWSDGPVEATAFALRALLAIDPDNALVEPVTNWLIKNRRGAQWSNTRDTAITVLAMTDYLRTSGELSTALDYELQVNGTTIIQRRIGAADVLSASSRFAVEADLIRDGANEIRIIRRSGEGAIYFAAEARFFSLEEPVTPAGNEVFVRRQYLRLASHPTLLKGHVYEREALNDGGTAISGERVEVVLTLEAKNDYEYLVIEDLKPAGLEAVQIRSGESLYAREIKSGAVEQADEARETVDFTGRSRWVYQELRDRKVALFIDKLPQGVWEIRYELRAEVPGAFHALPAMVHAMYVPEIRANGREIRLSVAD